MTIFLFNQVSELIKKVIQQEDNSVEQLLKKNIQLLKSSVEILNVINKGKEDDVDKDNNIDDLVEKIEAKIVEIAEGKINAGEQELNGARVKITKQDDKYVIDFLEVKDCSAKTLKPLQGLKLTVQKKDEQYKWGASFGKGKQRFHIGGLNDKLPRLSQVSALEGLTKPLVLIATPTGSGKTITKLMFALTAWLSGLRVVSVDHRGDLVVQEYKDQQGAVLFNSTEHLACDKKRYDENKTHNILSLDKFFASSNKIVNLDKFSKLIKDNNAENEGLKVDLKNKKIIIGKNIEIDRDGYKINGKVVHESIFDDEKLLVILDEIQEMVNQGQAYSVEIDLLLLLASWKKIKLVVATATPPKRVLDFIIEEEREKGEEKEKNAYIEAVPLSKRKDCGTIRIAACNARTPEEFVKGVIKHRNTEILQREEGEAFYYDHKKDKTNNTKKKIIEEVRRNLQSKGFRINLLCIDCDESKKLLIDKILSPEEQLKTLKSEKDSQGKENPLFDKKRHNKCDFYKTDNCSDLRESIKTKLIDTFGDAKATIIDEVLNQELHLTSSIADDGVLAVTHGFINNFIACVTGLPLHKLNIKRFSDPEFEDNFKKAFKEIETTGGLGSKIHDYVSLTLEIEDNVRAEQIREGMRIVWGLFIKYKDDKEKLSLLLSNHNLSREIHKMVPPDFSGLSPENIFEIFAQGHSDSLFKYLQDNYDVSQTMGSECEMLYREWKKADEAARKCKLESVDPAKKKKENAYSKLTSLKMQLLINGQRQGELARLEQEHAELSREYNGHYAQHQGLLQKANGKKEELIIKFREEVVKALQDEEKYQLHRLRPICNKLAVIEENEVEECLGDKLSRAGLVAWYANWRRKSGFDNTILYNVIGKMAQYIKGTAQQIVGRVGRVKGLIISSSYLSSPGINTKLAEEELEHGDPFNAGATEKSKTDTKTFAKKVTKQIKDIISGYDDAGESKVASEVVKCVFDAHHELYNHSGYKNVEAFEAFIKTLKNVTSALKAECEEKDIRIGDGEITINISGLDSKIDKITHELSKLYEELEPHKEKRDKIKEKLKIEGNFLKRLIIKLCTLVLRLWHWRLNPTQEKTTEILENDDPLTLNDRMLLKKAEAQLAEEMKPSENEIKKLEANKANFINQRTKLQDAFNKIHKTIGVIKRKDGVTQKEITESEKDSIIKDQLGGIEEELNKLKKSLSDSKKKHNKDLNAFETEGLKDKIDILEINIKEFKSELEEAVKLSDFDQALRNAQTKLQNDIIQSISSEDYYDSMKKIESLNNTIKEIEVITEKYKDFFDKKDSSIIKEQVTTLLSLCKKYTVSDNWSEIDSIKNNIEKGAKALSTALGEVARHIEVMPREQDDQESRKKARKKALEKTLKNMKECKNKTNIEVLYELICKGVAAFDIDKATYSDARELLSNINKLTQEKTRLEKIQRTQKGLEDEIAELDTAKRNLQDPAQQTNICNMLLVYKSIEKNYGQNRIIWTLAVFCYFLTNDKDKDDYISSTVFLELFTSVMMPLMNDGALQMAFDAMESGGNSAADKLKLVNELYQNLVDRKFDKIGKNDVSKAFGYMGEILLMIASTQVNHHISGISKGLNFINNINFGQNSSLPNNVTAKLQEHLSSLLQNHLGSSLQGLSGSNNNDLSNMLINSLGGWFEGKGLNLQSFNPLTQGIYTADVKSGIPVISIMNLLKNVLCFAAAEMDTSKSNKFVRAVVKKVSDTSIKEARKATGKFGEGKDQDDILKDVYEFLMILLNKLQKPNSETIWSYDLTTREEFAQIFQQLAVAAIAASQKKDCPASSFIDPSSDSLDSVQTTAKDFIARLPNIDNSNTTEQPIAETKAKAKGRPPASFFPSLSSLESGQGWQNLSGLFRFFG